MSKELLTVKDLNVQIAGKEILRNLNLSIGKGEVHVVMGRNGKGKSTLFSAIVGHPLYEITGGSIAFEGEDITDMSPDERARKGIFLSFQAPVEIPGITLGDFIRSGQGAVLGEMKNVFSFRKELLQKMAVLKMDEAYADRDLNVGFSGGEKKKAEILQMLMMNPKLALLDETDSGLDVDAIQNVAQGIAEYKNEENSIVIITHNAKLLEKIDVDFVHILDDGKIIQTGSRDLAMEIVSRGYSATEVK